VARHDQRPAAAPVHALEQSIAQLAHAVGYESEEAFSRAFKREFGLSPAHWREQAGGP
jgi:AraC-like DNA-binding protein